MTKRPLLCQKDLEQLVSKVHLPLDAFFYESIGSTNDEAKKKDKPSLLVSLEQTQGKGRLGRTWESKKNQGLYMSLLLRPQCEIDTLLSITQLVALNVARALGDAAMIKWPNDIYIEGKKICGILCETNLSGSLVDKLIIGIGVNLKPMKVEGRETTSVEEEGMDKSPLELLEAILKDFFDTYPVLLKEKSLLPFLEEMEARSYLTGKRVQTPEGYCYTFVGISPKGEALLEEKDERRSVLSGELSIKECS